MRNDATVTVQARAARVAGALYLLCMAPAIFAQFYVHGSLTVPDSATLTARNIIEHEQLFRIGIASDLIAFTLIVALASALFVLLRPVNESLALVATFWRLAEASILCVVTLGSLIALALLSGSDYLGTFDADQLQSLARLALGVRGAGYNIGLILFGLGSTVFSYLLVRSKFVPQALAAWGIFSSLLILVSAFWLILFPGSARAPLLSSYVALLIYELILGSWLLLKGARIQSTADSASDIAEAVK